MSELLSWQMLTLLLLLLLLATLVTGLLLILRLHRQHLAVLREKDEQLLVGLRSVSEASASTTSDLLLSSERLHEKAMALLSSKDPLALASVTRSLASSPSDDDEAPQTSDIEEDRRLATEWLHLADARGVGDTNGSIVPLDDAELEDFYDAAGTSFPAPKLD
jgi:hypothetical protein